VLIEINKAKLFFDTYGSELKLLPNKVLKKPTLIVLHGGHGFADHTLYVEFWSQFKDIVQIIFIDQHGCGRSEAGSEASWNLARWGNDLHLFCQMFGIEQPIIAGVSMGGHVIGEYVRHYADNLGGIILCNTEARFDLNALAAQFVKHGHLKAAESCLALYNDPNEETWQDYAKYGLPLYAKNAYSAEEKQRCLGNRAVFFNYLKHEVHHFDYREDLKKLNCPALIMAGVRGSHTPESAEEMAACIPTKWCQYEVFADAGAPVYKDEPILAEKVVREYLKKFTAVYWE